MRITAAPKLRELELICELLEMTEEIKPSYLQELTCRKDLHDNSDQIDLIIFCSSLSKELLDPRSSLLAPFR